MIDEAHVSVPQIGAMYEGDRARKQNLIDFGFRLPSALTIIILPAIYPTDSGQNSREFSVIFSRKLVAIADSRISAFGSRISFGAPVEPDVCATM